MKYRLMKWLICPHCKSDDLNLESLVTKKNEVYHSHVVGNEDPEDWMTEVVEGAIHCNSCGTIYPIREGVPRMVIGDLGPRSQHRTTVFNRVSQVWKEHFQELSSPLKAKDFLGRVVLDLGCGYGRHVYYAAHYGAEVIAIDSSEDAVLSTQRNTEDLVHVHVIQADGQQLPLKPQSIDRVYCYGVLHHVEQPKNILESATEVLRPGGTLSVWVYGPRQGFTLLVNNALRGATTSMDHEGLLKLSKLIAKSLRLFSHTPYKIFGDIPFIGSVVRHLPVHEHHKWPFDVVVADIYDRLRIPVLNWFTKEEIERWYANTGYVDFSVRRRVRNNETFCAIGVRR